MRALLAVVALLAAAAVAAPQTVEIKDLGLILLRARPPEGASAIPLDDHGSGSITIDEPGEYQLKLESKSAIAVKYVVEAEVGTDTPVVMDDSARQLFGAVRFATAPKLHIVEFMGSDSVILDTLAVGTPGTVIRVRVAIKSPAPEADDAEPTDN